MVPPIAPDPHGYGRAPGTHPGDPERVVLIGCAGSGKATLARALAARHTEIDELFAHPELAHARRLRFTSPGRATAWLASLRR